MTEPEAEAAEPNGAGPGRLERYARHEAGPLYTLFRRTTGDGETARDLLQETLMTALRHLDTYDSTLPFENWIFRIGQNRLRNFLRRRRLERKWIEPLAEELASGGPSPAANALAAERDEVLERAILRLPDRQRLAVLLRYQEGLSCAEIAAALEITANAVSIQLHHARRALKRLLGENLVGDHHR